MKSKKWWIMERDNFHSTYYVAMGQMSNTAARKREKPIHGSNTMRPYATEQLYNEALAKLKLDGKSIQ